MGNTLNERISREQRFALVDKVWRGAVAVIDEVRQPGLGGPGFNVVFSSVEVATVELHSHRHSLCLWEFGADRVICIRPERNRTVPGSAQGLRTWSD
ncbi:hypothetical protein [Gordonia sp. (in: high G+C Gram-positive bacteria)]|uniref:hypothetical protein n=1 Tax=Gordonia sp. (in: high G+C Gram-positive bacteria) TaxID=84139 RepID=UPI003C74FAC5